MNHFLFQSIIQVVLKISLKKSIKKNLNIDLISLLKVLTAGHCIVKQIQIPFGNNVFVANVTPNEYYPTMESMYTVYLGIQNYTSAIYTAQNIPDGGQKMAVSKVLPVSEK